MLLAYLLNVGLQCVTGLENEVVGEVGGVLALTFVRLNDVDQDCVQQIVGNEICLGDQRAEDVQHERFNLKYISRLGTKEGK